MAVMKYRHIPKVTFDSPSSLPGRGGTPLYKPHTLYAAPTGHGVLALLGENGYRF